MNKIVILKDMLFAFFSLTFIKDLVYSFSFYLFNRVHGLRKVSKGKYIKIRPGTLIRDPERVVIGDYTTIGTNNIIWAGKKDGKIIFGKNVMTGPYCSFFGFNHRFEIGDTPFIDQDCIDGDIIIKDNVWFGANVTVLANVRIGANSVIAAGSVVTKDVEPNTIVGGNVAKMIRRSE
jgi:acetyltransferase-like isoleucine patch superfamily enzyme